MFGPRPKSTLFQLKQSLLLDDEGISEVSLLHAMQGPTLMFQDICIHCLQEWFCTF